MKIENDQYKEKDISRFNDKWIPEPNSGCWIWTGACNPKGYGKMYIGGKFPSAHRVSWELFRGTIPKGEHVLHRCDTPYCVNPDHLFLGPQLSNSRDMVMKNRQARGEKSGKSKLTDEQVIEIRKSNLNNREIGERFGVVPSNVSAIRTRFTWRHIR